MDSNTGAELVVAVLVAASTVPYLIDTFAGRTKPQRASWAVFAALAAAATAAQVSEYGVTGGSVMTAVGTVSFTIVLIVSIKHGVGGTSVVDRVMLVGLAGVLCSWIVAGNHPLILPLLIAVEIPAIVVTIVKVVRMPGTESPAMWIVEAGASCVAVAIAPGFNSSMMIPTYNATVNLAVVVAIWWTSPSRRARRMMVAVPTLSTHWSRSPVSPASSRSHRSALSDHTLMTMLIPADHFDRPSTDLNAWADAAAWADATAVAAAALQANADTRYPVPSRP